MGDFTLLSPRAASMFSGAHIDPRSQGRQRSIAWCCLAMLASIEILLIISNPRLVHLNCCSFFPQSHPEVLFGSVSLSLCGLCLLLGIWAAFHLAVPKTYQTPVSSQVPQCPSAVTAPFWVSGASGRLIHACPPNLPCSHFYSGNVPRVLVQKMSFKVLGLEGLQSIVNML